MPTTTPPVQPVRVRPLWERHQLFREPAYDPSIALDDEDSAEDDDAPAPAR